MWEKVRGEFILTKNYLNNAAYTPLPLRTIEAIRDFFYEYSKYGPDSGDYYSEILGKVNQVRKDLSSLLDCEDKEIIFTEGATQSINFIAHMLPLKKGDEIVVRDSLQEHPSNYLPWLHLERVKGVKLKRIKVDKDGYPNLQDLEKAITSKTKALVITHALYNLGSIMPVKDMGKLAKEKGILFIVDGAQTLGCLPLSVRDMNCDFFIFTASKWICGPLGLGGFYCNKKVGEEILPFCLGDMAVIKYSSSKYLYNDMPFKLQEGFRNWGLVIALRESLNLIKSLGINNIRERNKKLVNLLREELKGLKGIKFYGPEEEEKRVSILSFTIKGVSPENLVKYLFNKGIVVAKRRLFRKSIVRVSPHFYNSEEEIKSLIKFLKEI